MKRQRGRNRGGGGGGGKPQQQNANRAFDSNGPDGVKVRGNAQTVFEKYQQLARDAGSGGDRVLAENYLQHAEHYFRTLRAMQPQRPASEILGRDQFVSGFDLDFEDESGIPQVSDAEPENDNGDNDNGDSRDRNGGWQARDDRQQDRQQQDRQPDRQRDDRPSRDDRQRNENRQSRWRDRDDRPRDQQQRDQQPRDQQQQRVERSEQPRQERQDPLPVVEPQSTPLPVSAAARERAPNRRREPVLRDAEGGESHAPAFLQNRPAPAVAAAPEPEAGTEESVRKPRRRRAPRSFEGGEGAPPTAESEDA